MGSKYIKPVCECGEQLVILEEYIFDIVTNITTKGFLFKKERIKSRSCPTGIFFLRCNKCYNDYEADTDSNGRYIRGEKR